MDQRELDRQNATFWNELCGSSLARSLGITDASPDSLKRFDAGYMRLYPYLRRYLTAETLTGKPVLEIGIGYGTLGQLLVERGCVYHGLDIAPNCVEMMRCRLRYQGIDPADRVRVGSALAIPFEDATFSAVYSIGCLHHTGDLPRAVHEVHRVLAAGGKAVVMLYHRHSYRRIRLRLRARLSAWRRRAEADPEAGVRAAYDSNAAGEAAPHTDYVSKREVRQLFGNFSGLRVDVQNFDGLLRGRIRRERLLNNIARVLGLDLYIVAVK